MTVYVLLLVDRQSNIILRIVNVYATRELAQLDAKTIRGARTEIEERKVLDPRPRTLR